MAWSLAVLAELESTWDWDVRTADVIVGTSAGAELACMLGGGTAVADLLRAQHGDPDAPAWITAHLAADPGRFPPRPRLGALRPASPGLAIAAARRRVPMLAGLTGLAPTGAGDPTWLKALAERMTDGKDWVAHPATWLVAADYDSGERVAFGSPGAPFATAAQAVAASWALPSWLPPVRIGSRRFVDGGVLSPASADLVAGLELDEVVVLAPMASSDSPRPRGALPRAECLLRRHMTRVLDAEIATLRAGGVRVHRFEPIEADLTAMRGNFMDARHRAATLSSATASIRATLARAGDEVAVG